MDCFAALAMTATIASRHAFNPFLRAKNALNAAIASFERIRSPNRWLSWSIRRVMSSGGSFSSFREIATASAGNAQISRATLRASASVWPGATTTLTKPASRASSAENVRPITSMAKARWWPMVRGINRLEAPSGTSPRLMNGVEKVAVVLAST